MQEVIRRLSQLVSPERLRNLTLALVRIPSPTGEAREVTEFYAEQVRALGIEVEVVHDYPSSPSTIARLGSIRGVPNLVLDGHLDTIHTPHVAPYVEGKRIVGRGAGDMKSGIAAIVEAARVIIESGIKLGGNLTLVTHSLHEAPIGHMEGLKALIARGNVFTDAALVAECGFNALAVRGKGQAVYEVEVTRAGEVMHENQARPLGIPNPLDYAARLAACFVARSQELARDDDPLLGPETYFLGQIHGGDFYNRVPTCAYVNGIARYWPDKDAAYIQAEFDRLLASVEHHPDLTVKFSHSSNGLGFEVAPEARVVKSLRAGYQQIVGRELPLVGELSVCDVNVIVREAGIAAVGHGTGSTTAHADLEWVELDNIVRTTQVFLATIVDYLGLA